VAQTIIPDYLNGDDVPADAILWPGHPQQFDLSKWSPNHTREKTRAPLDKVISALKEEGVTTFSASGYCFGARYAVDLALENVTKVIVLSHPSQLNAPEDFEKLLSQSKNPILINSCETDPQFPPEKQKIADDVLGSGKYAPGYERTYWPGCTHGFAVRGDIVRTFLF
jgi:dienelactone hydrolase